MPRKRPFIETSRLIMTLPDPSEAERVARYFRENRPHLESWDPPWPENYSTTSYWQERLARSIESFNQDLSLRLFLFFKEDYEEGPVLGHCGYSVIRRGPFQACYLGYSLDADAVGQGYMSEALWSSLDYVFEELNIHRVMANYLPTNDRSARLLRRLGFVVEGYARDYLFINGQWRDHILTSKTNPTWSPG